MDITLKAKINELRKTDGGMAVEATLENDFWERSQARFLIHAVDPSAKRIQTHKGLVFQVSDSDLDSLISFASKESELPLSTALDCERIPDYQKNNWETCPWHKIQSKISDDENPRYISLSLGDDFLNGKMRLNEGFRRTAEELPSLADKIEVVFKKNAFESALARDWMHPQSYIDWDKKLLMLPIDPRVEAANETHRLFNLSPTEQTLLFMGNMRQMTPIHGGFDDWEVDGVTGDELFTWMKYVGMFAEVSKTASGNKVTALYYEENNLIIKAPVSIAKESQ